MYSLVDLIQLSKINNLITIEATVDTGLESIAEEECHKKFGPELPTCCDRGRVYFNIPVSQYAQVCVYIFEPILILLSSSTYPIRAEF